MKVDIRDVDNLIITAIEKTTEVSDQFNTIQIDPQNTMWDRIYQALQELREIADED